MLIMVIFTSGVLYHTKLDDLTNVIKGIDTYINDILVLSKYDCPKHIDHLLVIFARLRGAGPILNTTKWSFGLK